MALIERSAVVDGRLVYSMSKTDKERSVKLQPPAKKIARYYLDHRSGSEEPWLFPLLDGEDLSTPEDELRALHNVNEDINGAVPRRLR